MSGPSQFVDIRNLINRWIYGEISVKDNANVTTITVKDTKVQFTEFTTNGESNGTTPDQANDQLTIDTAGHYFVFVSIHADSVAGAAAKFEFNVYKNNGATQLTDLHAHEDFAGGGSETSGIDLMGVVDLDVNDDLEVWVTNNTNTQNIVLTDVTMSVLRVGG